MTVPDAAAIDPRFFFRAKQRTVSDISMASHGRTLDLITRREHDTPFPFQATENVDSRTKTPDISLRLLDPIEAYSDEIKSRVVHIQDTVSAYDDRIEVLKKQAELDGYSLNPASQATFLEFFRRNPLIRRGRLVLMESGNLRAVWKGENGAHIGLQFLHNRSIQYVIFKHRKPSFPVSRVYGHDTTDGIIRQIDAFDLGSVLYT